MTNKIKLGILGSTGKTGAHLVSCIAGPTGATSATGSLHPGGDFEIVARPRKGESLSVLLQSDAIVDFSTPDAAMELIGVLKAATDKLPVWIVGTTGWKLDQRKQLEALTAKTPIMVGSNFSVGVLAMMSAIQAVAPTLEKLGYMGGIIERHHRHKKDSPSGTALSLQSIVSPSAPGAVQIQSVRAGEVVGEHEVSYYGAFDRIMFTHIATDRRIFAQGALHAAKWLFNAERDPIQRPTLLGRLLRPEEHFREWT